MPILRKRITPEFLPILARAQWALAADVMRRSYGGDLISRAALRKFRELAKATEDLVELVEMTGSEEIHTVAFYDSDSQTFTDRQLIDWAVEFYAEEAGRGGDDEKEWHKALALLAHWNETDWREYGR